MFYCINNYSKFLKQTMSSISRNSSSRSHMPSSSDNSDNVINNKEISIMNQEKYSRMEFTFGHYKKYL
jgi:hypothetical protein